MKGKNTLELNQDTMKEAVQSYLDWMLDKPNQVVLEVEQVFDKFIVKVEARAIASSAPPEAVL